MTTESERVAMACGFVAHDETSRAWAHPGYDVGEGTDDEPLGPMFPKDCPGYTTRLSSVVMTVGSHVHWKNQTLLYKLDGIPSKVELVMLEQLESQYNALEAWSFKRKTND